MSYSSIPKLKDVLKYYLFNGGCIGFEKYDGTLALATLDNSATVGTISDSDLLLDDNKYPRISTSFTDIKNCITRIDLRYQRIVPLSDRYAQTKFCRRSNDPLTDGGSKHNFTLSDTNGGWQFYSELLEQSYNRIGYENPLTIDADGIRDADTAEKLARLLILMRYKPLAQLSIDAKYTMLAYEIGDKVNVNFDSIPAALNAKVYMITGSRIVPNVGTDEPFIKISLTELGAASLPESTTLQDSYGTGDTLVDSLNGVAGTEYKEII
jgi:hypothetical protein